MRRAWLLLLVLVAWPASVLAGQRPPAQWIVVVAPAFRSAVVPLCAQRKAQGMKVVVIETTDVLSSKEILAGDAHKLQQKIARLCGQTKGTSYILLVGAVEAGKLANASTKVLPPLQGTTGRMKGQPTDNGYALPDRDLLATVAVGRFPARTKEEAEQMVRKTLGYEKNSQPGEWRHRVTVLAGVPAFNPLVDQLVENLAMARFDRLAPAWSGRAIYHNAQSRFCVPDDRLHDQALTYVQAGQAFTVYLGHSDARGFYAGRARFLDRDDWARLKIARGPGIFATFGCNGCQLCGPNGEGYGLAAIRNPNGPVAVIGSHGVCFAAMVELATDGLFQSFFATRPPERLGATWLAIKAALARGKIDALTFKLLDAVDGNSSIPQAVQRREHQEMFVLLGDPALRLPELPTGIKLTCALSVSPGVAVTVAGELPASLPRVNVRITLERPASSVPADLQPLPLKPPDKRAQVMLANHKRANHFVLVAETVMAKDRHFKATLVIPAKLPWKRLIVRAHARQAAQEAMGVLALPVKPSRTSPRPD